MELKVEYSRNEFAETRMAKDGIKWVKKQIAIDTIDMEVSLHNKARPDFGINVAHRDDLTVKIKLGEHLPSPVLAPLPRPKHKSKGDWQICDGLHTTSASHEAGAKYITAYCIIADPALDIEIYDSLPRRLNCNTKLPIAKEAQFQSALREIEMGTRNLQDAADAYILNVDVLRVRWKHDMMRRLLEKNGFLPDDLKGTVTGLAPLYGITLDSVKIAAARVSVKAELTERVLDTLIKEINSNSNSEAAQMAVVAKWEKDYLIPDEVTGGSVDPDDKTPKLRPEPNPLRKELIAWVNKGCKLHNGKSKLQQFGIGKTERPLLAQKLAELYKSLVKIVSYERQPK